MAVATAQDKSIEHRLMDAIVINRHALVADTVAVATTAATNSTPYGFSQAQADSIVAKLNTVITNQNSIFAILKQLGVMASS